MGGSVAWQLRHPERDATNQEGWPLDVHTTLRWGTYFHAGIHHNNRVLIYGMVGIRQHGFDLHRSLQRGRNQLLSEVRNVWVLEAHFESYDLWVADGRS